VCIHNGNPGRNDGDRYKYVLCPLVVESHVHYHMFTFTHIYIYIYHIIYFYICTYLLLYYCTYLYSYSAAVSRNDVYYLLPSALHYIIYCYHRIVVIIVIIPCLFFPPQVFITLRPGVAATAAIVHTYAHYNVHE
jgi:hypothetical protein